MSRSLELTLTTALTLGIAGCEVDYDVTVNGTYHPYQPPYYGGEMAPIDPPEPATFEIASATATINGKAVDILPLLKEPQVAAIMNEGILEIES